MDNANIQQTTGLQVFYNENENVSVRTKVIDGVPWFVGKDVCDLLGLVNSRKSLQALDEDEKGVTNCYTLGGNQNLTFINESGLYHLIFISRKPEAKAIRRWVTGTVLPSIRRTGSYSVNNERPESTKRLPLPKKVYAGTAMSYPVAKCIQYLAKKNRQEGRTYPEKKPAYEQLCITWEE